MLVEYDNLQIKKDKRIVCQHNTDGSISEYLPRSNNSAITAHPPGLISHAYCRNCRFGTCGQKCERMPCWYCCNRCREFQPVKLCLVFHHWIIWGHRAMHEKMKSCVWRSLIKKKIGMVDIMRIINGYLNLLHSGIPRALRSLQSTRNLNSNINIISNVSINQQFKRGNLGHKSSF